jgi:hypothetical protein
VRISGGEKKKNSKIEKEKKINQHPSNENCYLGHLTLLPGPCLDQNALNKTFVS